MLAPLPDPPRGTTLLGLLGDFWVSIYGGNAQVLAHDDALARAGEQTHAQLLETQACLARDTVPLLALEEWRLLVIRRSTTIPATRPVRYGEGDHYGSEISYGQQIPNTVAAIPRGDLATVPWIFNRISQPSLSWAAGLDYTLTADQIIFRTNPFDDPRWSRRPICDAVGQVIDEEIFLWLFRSGRDLRYTYVHHGYLLGLNLPSTAGYRQLVQAALDAFVVGSTGQGIGAALAAITGVPLARAAGTVQVAGQDEHGGLVVTETEVYRLPAQATLLVAVGDTVASGDSLCDALEVIELNRGWTAELDLPTLVLDAGLLGAGYQATLAFSNQEQPLEVRTDTQGRTEVRFATTGFPADVERFWTQVHARGVAAGTTLADYLTPLPATVNPVRFLINHLLRGNLVVVRLRATALPPGSPGLVALGLLRRLVPPHTTLYIVVILPDLVDAFQDSFSDALEPSLNLDDLTDTEGSNRLESLTARLVNASC